MAFKLSIDLTGHEHPHSATAHRAFIGMALDQAKQAVCSSAQMEGDLKVPVAHVPDPVVIGHWKIEL